MLLNSSGVLEKNVRQIKIADYYNKDPRKSLLLPSEVDPLDRMLRIQHDNETPIKLLDNIIQSEE